MANLNLSNIKLVSFDAADTLFYIKNGLGAAYAEIAEKYGASPGELEIKRAFSHAFASAPPLAFGEFSQEERKKLEKQWWKNVVRDVYERVGMFDDFDSYFEELFDHFKNRAWTAFPDSASALGKIKKMGYEIMLVSNFDSRVYGVLKELELENYFSSFTISSEAGFSKPSPEIFRIALEKHGAKPEECLHIGDDMEKDYIGATNAGIKSLLLLREGEADNTPSIRSLEQIPQLLGETVKEARA